MKVPRSLAPAICFLSALGLSSCAETAALDRPEVREPVVEDSAEDLLEALLRHESELTPDLQTVRSDAEAGDPSAQASLASAAVVGS